MDNKMALALVVAVGLYAKGSSDPVELRGESLTLVDSEGKPWLVMAQKQGAGTISIMSKEGDECFHLMAGSWQGALGFKQGEASVGLLAAKDLGYGLMFNGRDGMGGSFLVDDDVRIRMHVSGNEQALMSIGKSSFYGSVVLPGGQRSRIQLSEGKDPVISFE